MKTIQYLAAGLLLATVGMLMTPTLLGAFFILVDLIIGACCFYLIVAGRRGGLQVH